MGSIFEQRSEVKRIIDTRQNKVTSNMQDLIPGIPNVIVEDKIWTILKNLFTKAAKERNYTKVIIDKILTLRSVSQKWKNLVNQTYLMGIVKISIKYFEDYKYPKTPLLKAFDLPWEFFPDIVSIFYSKYPKLKCLGTIPTEIRSRFLKTYDSWNPIKKWDFTIWCYEMGYLEENPFFKN